MARGGVRVVFVPGTETTAICAGRVCAQRRMWMGYSVLGGALVRRAWACDRRRQRRSPERPPRSGVGAARLGLPAPGRPPRRGYFFSRFANSAYGSVFTIAAGVAQARRAVATP